MPTPRPAASRPSVPLHGFEPESGLDQHCLRQVSRHNCLKDMRQFPQAHGGKDVPDREGGYKELLDREIFYISSRPRSSTPTGRGGTSNRLSSQHSIGSIGSSTVDCSSQSETSRQWNTKLCTMNFRKSRPWGSDSPKRVSEEPGTIQFIYLQF